MVNDCATRPFERVLLDVKVFGCAHPAIAFCLDDASRAIAGIGVNFNPVVAVTECLADAQAENGWSPATGRPQYIVADPALLRNVPSPASANLDGGVPYHLKKASTALASRLFDHLTSSDDIIEEPTKALTCRTIQWAVRENKTPNRVSLLSAEENWKACAARYPNRLDFGAQSTNGPSVVRTEILEGGLIEIGCSIYSADKLAEMDSNNGSTVLVCLFPDSDVWVVADPHPFPARRVPDLPASCA